MQFNEYTTAWDLLKKSDRSKCSGFNDYYKKKHAWYTQREHLCESNIDIISEWMWHEAGKPYYKLWPGYAMALSKTSLNVPVEAFQVPFDSFVIRLPKDPELFTYEFKGRKLSIRSLLVSRLSPTRIPVANFSVLIEDGEQHCSYIRLNLDPELTIEQCLRRAPMEGTTSPELIITALRLAVAVSLLAVSVHRYVEHDVIARLRNKYDRATTASEREHLAAKSRRRGVNGWCIGRGRCLSLTTRPGVDDSEPSDRQLSHQHIRGGHFHTVRYGPGRSKRKVMFFEPTVVRPDLPPAPYGQARAS